MIDSITYLELIKRYPEARADILELRRIKNLGNLIINIGIFLISLGLGVLFGRFVL